MYFVQYIPAHGGSLITETYASASVARLAFDSLTHIAWAELVGPEGEVLAYREGVGRKVEVRGV